METIKDLGAYTFPALFANTMKKFGDRPALAFASGEPISYREVEKRVNQVSKLLVSMNVKKGDRVAIFSTSAPNWGAAYLGIVNIGAIAVPLLPDFNPLEVETILKHAEVSGIFVAEKMFSKIKDFDPSILPFVISVKDFSFLRGTKPENMVDELPVVEVNEEDTASIIYTSGTTGRSKGVELSHKNLVFTALQAQTIQRVNKRDVCLSFLPLSHVYEFSLGFVLQILNGSCVYYLERPPTVSSLLPALKKVRPTIVLSVPMVVEKIYKNKVLPTFTKTDFIKKLYEIRFWQKKLHWIAGKSLKKTFGGRVKFFGIGGAKVDPVVERFMKDAKFPYAIGYGLTETSPLLAGTNPKYTVPGSVGPYMCGIEMKIMDPDPKTGIGEVIARGNNIMKGYYKDPDLTSSVFTTENDSVGSGWFKTGDLGELRNGMWLSLKGRLKNMILGSSGENIYPEDIEFVLNQHPLVLESLVVEDDDGLVALVQLNEEKVKEEAIEKQKKGLFNTVEEAISNIKEDILYKNEEILSEIQFFVNEKVNRFSKIGKVKAVREFEKTASQKIKRYLYNLKNGDSKK
jgi:long-chain acyl-CoA synthetase